MLPRQSPVKTLAVALGIGLGACTAPLDLETPRMDLSVQEPVPDKLETRLYSALTRETPKPEHLRCYDATGGNGDGEQLYVVTIRPQCFSGDYALPEFQLHFLVTPPHTYTRLIDQKTIKKGADIQVITFGLSPEDAERAGSWYAQTVIDAQALEDARVQSYRRLHPGS